MKVNGSTTQSTSLDKSKELSKTGASQTKGRGGSGKTPVATEGAEKVSISSRAKETAEATRIAKAAPDVNEEKVAKLKAAVQSGAYKVDAQKIADKLVDEHLGTAI
jgi:negative regulator of flagellin synthesis FlgM